MRFPGIFPIVVTALLPALSGVFASPLPSKVAAEALAGYYFVYFTGDDAAGERIFSAVSNGNDPLHWTKTNGGNTILTSTVGTKGLRDPSLVRGSNNEFYIIATDMLSTNWDQVQRHGSRSIVVFKSTDLVNWTPTGGNVREVIGTSAGNVWAPTAVWDPTNKNYFVAFASAIFASNDPNHTGSFYQRVMYTTTTDFVHFTPAQAYIDRGSGSTGYATIDTDFLRATDGKTLYRFTKNEGGRSTSNPQGKTIFQEVSTSGSPLGPWSTAATGIGSPLSVEGPTTFADNLTAGKYWAFLDNFDTNTKYYPLSTTNIASGGWTAAAAGSYAMPSSSTRHGTVIPIYKSEYDRIRAALVKS